MPTAPIACNRSGRAPLPMRWRRPPRRARPSPPRTWRHAPCACSKARSAMASPASAPIPMSTTSSSSAMQGVLAAKKQVAGKLDVEVVAFSTSRNDLAQPEATVRLKDAIALGPNLIGASLNASADPARALAALLDLAEASRLPVDLHLDEHLEPHRTPAGQVADAVIARGP